RAARSRLADVEGAVEDGAAAEYPVHAVARERAFPVGAHGVAAEHRVTVPGREEAADHNLAIVAMPACAADRVEHEAHSPIPVQRVGTGVRTEALAVELEHALGRLGVVRWRQQ